MKIELFDKTGKKKADYTTKKGLFELASKVEILKQFIVNYMLNKRQGTASVKNRGDVSGSGKKPWAQKGTGRARVGSKRTPLWRHGGIVHGPKPKSWSIKTNKNIKAQALLSAISYKVKTNDAVVFEDLDLKGKTKNSSDLLKKLGFETRNSLFVFETLSDEIRNAFGNLKKVDLADVTRINAFQVVKADKVVFLKNAMEKLEERLGAKYEIK